MKCPHCQSGRTEVHDSRHCGGGAVNRRRRACKDCGKRFTTYETVECRDAVDTELVRSHLQRLREDLERLESKLGSRPAPPTDGEATEPASADSLLPAPSSEPGPEATPVTRTFPPSERRRGRPSRHDWSSVDWRWKNPEIAKVLGCTAAAVSARRGYLKRAMKKAERAA